MENNGQISASNAQRDSSSSTHSAGGSGGLNLLMFSGSAHYNYDNTQTNENENSVQASSGWSNARSSSASNSHTINTNFCDSNEQCKTGSSTSGGTVDTSRGKSEEKELTVSFTLPGNKDAIENSKDVVAAKTFMSSTSGSIAVSEVECQTYRSKIDLHDFPAFTDTFKNVIVNLHDKSLELTPYRFIVTKVGPTTQSSTGMKTVLNTTTEQALDRLFSNFIGEFGTHFIEDGSFGGKMVYKSNIKNFNLESKNTQEVKNCFDQIHQKRLEKKFFNENEKNICSNQDVQNQVEKSLQAEDVKFFSKGAHIANVENIAEWTASDFKDPDLISFKLYPIMILFDKIIMRPKCITDNAGNSININAITSWMMPRYVALLKRCKTMANHRVSDNGSGCVRCPRRKIPTQDGLGCQSKNISTIIKSFK